MPWTTNNPHIYGVAWWREGTRIGIAFDYDPDAVERIKRLRPGVRKFDPGLRCWFVTDEAQALDLIAELPQYVGGPPEFFDGRPDWLALRAEWITKKGWERDGERREDAREQRQRTRRQQRSRRRDEYRRGDEFREARQGPTSAGPHRVLHLQTDAPPELIAAAYKALARLHHPDAGGNEERMKAINNAYEELTK